MRCSIKKLFLKLRNIHRTNRKTPVFQSLFNSEYCEIFKRTYSEEHLWTAASENVIMKLRTIKNCLWEILTLHKKTGFFNINMNKRNNKRFNNHGYALFFLMTIFPKHLWLILNILKWQDCKIFTKLQPFTKYLRLTLVFLWNSALREKFNFCFSRVFASIDKISILAGRLGARLSFYEV